MDDVHHKGPRTVRLHQSDDVVIAVDALKPGMMIEEVIVREFVPRGHKLAIRDIAAGAAILKVGQMIGVASSPIAQGSWVHDHNCVMPSRGVIPTRKSAKQVVSRSKTTFSGATFEGYRRSNGKVGTRNYLGILTSVNCAASVARLVAREIERSGVLDDFPRIDGIIPLVHGTGCGMASAGTGFDTLRRSLWGYAANPNMAGILMVGLGCEVLQIGRLKHDYGLTESDTFRTLIIQETGGTRKSVEASVAAIKDMLPAANDARRETIPASELVLALQCGGSDGYSGITANPALGAAVDILVAEGGTAILSETPEIYGAEHLLLQRASDQTGKRIKDFLVWWEDYAARHGGDLNNNPSPGNKAGGLTTILEKSLGAVAKAGTSRVVDAVAYGEPVTARGLVFMDTPGFDPVSATGQVAGGANVLCFTTGRGSAYGNKPTPSIKLATTSELYRRMEDDMDIDCGDILDGVSLEEKGREIFKTILAVASGTRTKSEIHGYGDVEFAPWIIGATM